MTQVDVRYVVTDIGDNESEGDMDVSLQNTERNGKAGIDDLPPEVFQHILLNLLWTDLLSAIGVSKYWWEALSLHYFWVKKLKIENLDHLLEITKLCCNGSSTDEDQESAQVNESLDENEQGVRGEGSDEAVYIRGAPKVCNVENQRETQEDSGGICSLKKAYFEWHSTRDRWAYGNIRKRSVEIDNTNPGIYCASDGEVVVVFGQPYCRYTTFTSKLIFYRFHQDITVTKYFTIAGILDSAKISGGFLFVITEDWRSTAGLRLSKYLIPQFRVSDEGDSHLIPEVSIVCNTLPHFLTFGDSKVALDVENVAVFRRLNDLNEVNKQIKYHRPEPDLAPYSCLLSDDVFVVEFIKYSNLSYATLMAWSVESGEMIWWWGFEEGPYAGSGLSLYWKDGCHGYVVCSQGDPMLLLDLKSGEPLANVDEEGRVLFHDYPIEETCILQACEMVGEIIRTGNPGTLSNIEYPSLYFTKEGFVVAQFQSQLWIGDTTKESGKPWSVYIVKGIHSSPFFEKQQTVFISKKRIVFWCTRKYEDDPSRPSYWHGFYVFDLVDRERSINYLDVC